MSGRARRLWAAAGVAAAVVIAVLLNMLSSRHFKRWDWTSSGLYSISNVTEQTLRTLTEEVEIQVLLSRDDPLTLTLHHLLDAYRAINPSLAVEFIDPDLSPAAFMAVQQKHGVAAAKTEDGRVITDAQIIVARGDRRHFITADDLFEVQPGEEAKARTRVERVITAAIRQVTRGQAPRVCITSGFGEAPFDQGGVEGLMALTGRLTKSNYQVAELPPLRALDGADPIQDCDLVIVAGPSLPMGRGDVGRLSRYVRDGGSALVFVGPELDDTGSGYVDIGLDPLIALAGVRKRNDFVFERDPSRVWPIGQGEAFIAGASHHPVTEGLAQLQGAINVVLTVVSSLEPLPDASVEANELLTTTARGFGMADFVAWAQSRPEPAPSPGDTTGPVTVAYAAELSPGGSRMVIVGTKSAVLGANWTNERLRGTALFVESAVSWLASEPVVLDIASKPAPAVGSNITEQILGSAVMKVVVALPLSMVFLGVAIRLRRRDPAQRKRKKKAQPQDDDSGEQDDDSGEQDDDGSEEDAP